jgi:hypothetical protein
VILPTPAEYAAMSWHARSKAVNAVLRAQRLRVRDIDATEWATGVQDEARTLLAAMPVDPDAAAHRAGVLR